MKQLNPEQYSKAKAALQKVSFNNYFARSVIEKHVNGRVYADCQDHPTTFYVLHPYGMSLLFGNPNNHFFNRQFRDYVFGRHNNRSHAEWMQAFPKEWDDVLPEIFRDQPNDESENGRWEMKDVIERHTRVNFSFNHKSFQAFRNKVRLSEYEIIFAERNCFTQMEGSVIPKNFWDSEDDFLSKGAGYYVMIDGQPASCSFSAFVHDNILELGIETLPSFRGMGLATYACVALIDYCLARKLLPIWSCRLENTSSYKLALKLGFEPVKELPYYKF